MAAAIVMHLRVGCPEVIHYLTICISLPQKICPLALSCALLLLHFCLRWFDTISNLRKTLGLFTKERITFRKPFRIAIRFLIGFVIWTIHVRSQALQPPVSITNRICALRGNILFLLRRLAHAWLQRAFPKCARTNHVPKELCIHKSSESGFLGGSRSKTPPFLCFKSLIWKSFAFTKGKIMLFKSGKGQNHNPKWLSERDSLLCEQAHCLMGPAFHHLVGTLTIWMSYMLNALHIIFAIQSI